MTGLPTIVGGVWVVIVATAILIAYGLVGILLVVPMLPSPAIAWVAGFGILIECLVATPYWIRFANAGLSLTSWMGRQ